MNHGKLLKRFTGFFLVQLHRAKEHGVNERPDRFSRQTSRG
jgi:hypothetical protein